MVGVVLAFQVQEARSPTLSIFLFLSISHPWTHNKTLLATADSLLQLNHLPLRGFLPHVPFTDSARRRATAALLLLEMADDE